MPSRDAPRQRTEDLAGRIEALEQALVPGTAGQKLQTNGAGADPSWA